MITVTEFRDDRREWDAFIESAPDSTISHSSRWADIIEQVYGHRSTLLMAREHGRIVGVLPLVDVCSLVFGRFTVSMPYLNGGGPIGSAAAVAALSDAAEAHAQRHRMNLLELRCRAALPIQWSAVNEKVACVLSLATTPADLWSRLGSKLRSQIRRPMKEGLEVRFGSDQLDPFFRVFARNMRDLGSPPHPQRFFEEIAHAFGAAVWFGCVYLRGMPVAGGCALVWRDEIEMTWASSLREFSACAPNMLLYWSFIERACEAGLQRFDFGRCTPNSGSHRFKQQWGARDLALYWYRTRNHQGRELPKQSEGSLSLASRLWRRMPARVATTLGPRLRGGIPS